MPVEVGPDEDRAASKPNVGQSVPAGAVAPSVAAAGTATATASAATSAPSRILVELEMGAPYPVRPGD